MAATAPPQASVPYPAGQPVFVQPGVPPVGVPMAAAAPGTVLYYPQMHGGAGGILMVCMQIKYSVCGRCL